MERIEAPSSTRQELLDFARAEFEQHRHVNDLVSLESLLLNRCADTNQIKGPYPVLDIGKHDSTIAFHVCN